MQASRALLFCCTLVTASSFLLHPPFMTVTTTARHQGPVLSATKQTDGDADHRSRLFIFGLGYVGLSIARAKAHDEGWKVAGTVSSGDKADRLAREEGFDAYLFNASSGPMEDPRALEALRHSTHVLVTIAPMRGEGGGDGVLRWHANDIQQGIPGLQWLGYLSSTGVYGDHQGAWVTEDDHPSPNTEIGKARLQAEEAWASLDFAVPLHVFRLAGIYGPGRSAVDTLRKKGGDLAASGVSGEHPAYISRIHVDDISTVVRLSMQQPREEEEEQAPRRAVEYYNLADDRPATRYEVFRFAEGLLGQGGGQEPSSNRATTDAAAQVSSSSPPPARSSRQAGSKRVSNAKMRRQVLEPAGADLAYPDYVAGLTAIVSSSSEDQCAAVTNKM